MLSRPPINQCDAWSRPWLLSLLFAIALMPGCRGSGESSDPVNGQADESTLEDRIPVWVDKDPQSDLDFDRFVVRSQLWSTEEEAHSMHEELLQKELRSRMDKYLVAAAGRSDAHELVSYEPGQFMNFVDTSTPYLEEDRGRSVGLMYQLHSLVEVNRSVEKKLTRLWLDFQAIHRVGQLASYWLAIVGSIGIVFLNLRMRQVQTSISPAKRNLLSAGLSITLLIVVAKLSQMVLWI